MTSLHKQIIDSHNNDIAKLKSSLSNKAAARRSVCLPSNHMAYLSSNENESSTTNNTSSNNPLSPLKSSTAAPKSILKTGISKEEPIISKSSSTSNTTSSSSTTTTTTSSSSSTKKIPDRPSINPGFRKPKEALLSGTSSSTSSNSTYRKSTIGASTSNIKPPSQISSSILLSPSTPSTTTTTTTNNNDDTQIKHTAASLSKMKLSGAHTIDSQRSTMKTRSVSISNGSLFSPNHTSANNTSPPSTNTTSTKTPIKSNDIENQTPTTPKTPITTTPTKTNIDDVFARLANVTKPTIKSRSLSVSASLSKEQQKDKEKEKEKEKEHASLSSKFTKILKSSKTPTSSPSTSKSTVTTPRERKDTKSLSSFKSSSASKVSTSSSTSNLSSSLTPHSISESNSHSSQSLISSPPPSTPSNNLTSILVQQQSSPSLSNTSPTISKCPSPSPNSSSSKQNLPILTPAVALKLYINELTAAEQSEILDYPQIYFTGNTTKKIQPNPKLPNNGFDNEGGEYKIVEHDHIAYRFEVVSILGQGSFCQVVKAYDYKSGDFVALKILRNQKRFHEQALTEIKILEYLKNNDPNSTANIVHLNNYFYFRNHLCLTFELLSMSLYDFLKINHFQGYNIGLVWRFGAQILTSLKFLSKRNIIHADLKPENILLKQPNKSGIKIIDFGSSCFENEQIFPYIQSRFYRSPEVILGVKYDKAIDIWSLGCILVEIFTGSPLFPGADEPEQLACIMEVLGAPPKQIINSSTRRDIFFEEDGTPKQVKNSTTGEIYGVGTKPLKDLIRSGDDDFDDFILDCLKWIPSERITAEQGLKHEWVLKYNNNK